MEPYFHHLVANLLRLDQETHYVLLANSWNALEFAGLRGENLSRHVVRTLPTVLGAARHVVHRVAARTFGAAPPRPLQPPAGGLAGLGLDFIHCFPAYIDPASQGIPCIVTVADLQHEFYPEFFSPEELHARHELLQPSAEQAVRIIALSEFTRQTIVDRFRVAADKVSVIHLGVSSRFLAPPQPEHVTRVRRRYHLPDAYCIYPANLWPHKNHPRLLAALASIPAARRPHLVLTGSPTRTQTPLHREIKERELGAYVSWLGFVDAEDLPALLAGARLMVFPSLFEGFGMPVVEAMAAGCPVACANATALPEVAADAAWYFDPTLPDAIG
ncbi:MAG: hypothetical protein A3J75_01110, partial [Acidobacteria bacterium RBG_16_68_9]